MSSSLRRWINVLNVTVYFFHNTQLIFFPNTVSLKTPTRFTIISTSLIILTHITIQIIRQTKCFNLYNWLPLEIQWVKNSSCSYKRGQGERFIVNRQRFTFNSSINWLEALHWAVPLSRNKAEPMSVKYLCIYSNTFQTQLGMTVYQRFCYML